MFLAESDTFRTSVLKSNIVVITDLAKQSDMKSNPVSCNWGLNQLDGQNIIFKKRTETSEKREFSAVYFNLKIYTFRYTSGL